MRKNSLILLLTFFLFNSCQYFEKQVPSEKELLQKELKAINWTEVDEFPSIFECDSVQDKVQKKQCFFEYLTQLIQQKLSVDTLSVLYPKLDTINVTVTVFPDSTMQFETEIIQDTLDSSTPIIDSIIKARLVDFPKVNPAIKRGIPVKTQFVLPVIVQMEKDIVK